jgi:hypothetical protein
VEVFKNAKGEYYFKDVSGKAVLLSQDEVADIQTETKIVQEIQNFVYDKNGKRQEVKIDANGVAYYTDSNGKKVQIPKQGSPKLPELFLDEDGRAYVLDANGQRQTVETDANGQPYYLDENGHRVDMASAPVANFQAVFKDAHGNAFIVDKKTGKKLQVLENEFGQQYYVDESGHPQLINQAVVQTDKPQVLTGPDGKAYILDQFGRRQDVLINEFGEPCVLNEDGFMVPVSQMSAKADASSQFSQQIFTSESGDKFILDANGERLYIKTDAKGNQYFENKFGQKQLIPKDALKQPPVFMNEKGEVYVKDKNGKVQKVQTDQFGQMYVTNARGEKVPVGKQQPPIFHCEVNEKGEKFILDKNGKKIKVQVDKDGNTYVVGENGQKTFIQLSAKTVTQEKTDKPDKKMVF